MYIEDGTGSGRTVAVNKDNKLEVVAITASTEHDTNHHNGQAYNANLEQNPHEVDPSAEEEVCIFYFKNTSEIDVTFEGFSHRLAGTDLTDAIEIRGGDDGNPAGGAILIPANMNLGSGNTAQGTFLAGDNITGLSGGTLLQRVFLESNGTKYFNFDQDIIVPKNRILTIYSMTPAAKISLGIGFNYHATIGERS
jgi:hypothetical protein